MYKPAPFLAPLLFVPGLVFEALVRARNSFYYFGLLNPSRLPGPVISIGNLTLGGSGKTPLVILVAQLVRRLGHTPALLSRGYGRGNAADAPILPPHRELPCPAGEFGDEPALIRRYVPEMWLGISRDRHDVGRRIAEEQRELVFVLDDGFQHRRLHRDLDIVVIDGTQPLLRNSVFPRGSLREPLSGLCRCHAVVLNGPSSGADRDAIERTIRRWNTRCMIFSCMQRIDSLVPFKSWEARLPSSTKCAYGYLAAALGNPARFCNDVKESGVNIVGSKFFRDHHPMGPADWQQCIQSARRRSAEAIIITEKDAIKVARSPDFPVLVAVQSVSLDKPEEFERMIAEAIRNDQ